MHAASRPECPSRSCSGFLQRTCQQPLDQYAGLRHQQRSAHTTFCFPSCQQRRCTSVADSCVYCAADWDNASLSNESLLDTVSRFVLAALLKHTGLLGQGCGEGRYCCRTLMRCSTEQQPKLKHVTLFFFSVRYQPSKSLAEVYRSVYKVRNRLLACKNIDFIQTRSSSRERRVS